MAFPCLRALFHRMKRKAIKLGILTVKATERKNGSQSSNLWIFNQFLNTNDTPNESENLTNKDSSESGLTPQENQQKSKTSNLLKDKIRTDKPVRKNPPTFVSSWVNKQFASYFFQPKEVEEFWRISYIHGKQFEICSGDVVEVSIDSLKALVSKMKSKSIRNPLGFYNGIIKRKMRTKYLHDLFISVLESA